MEKKQKSFLASNIKFKVLIETGMMCTIDGDLGTSYHITNNDSVLHDITNINELVHGSSGSLPTTNKRKLLMKVQQVDKIKKSHTGWLVKYCTKVGLSFFLLTSECSQCSKMSDVK